MSSFSPGWRVDLRLRPSRLFLLLNLALHLAALLAVWQCGLALSLRWGISFLLLLSVGLGWRQEMGQAGLVVRENANGWWVQTPRHGGQAELRRCQVWRYLVVMDFHCRAEGRVWRQHVVVLPGAVPADTFRRLRVRLRYGARPASAHGLLQRSQKSP